MEKINLFQIRLRAPHTESDAQWAETAKALSSNRRACDEVWFSTGILFPEMSWHREHTERLARYANELRRAGIAPSLQFQATLGHGDSFGGSPKMMAGRTWSGFTGPTGVECKFCNCPRQPRFLDYIREMARLYAAAIRPEWLWIDDDLRVNNHLPAARWEDIGCWCDTCRRAFLESLETQESLESIESLAAAISGSPALAAAWERFSFGSIAAVARAITEETHAVSPETRFGYQHAPWPNDLQLAVFAALREASGGRPVGSRPGGGAYYDLDPNGPVKKALIAARQRRVLGAPDWIDTWLPEIETYPRAFASRTARGILLEAIASLAYGMNGLSALIMDTRAETDAWYAENILAPLAAERGTIERYRESCAGTFPCGLGVPATLPIDGVYHYALAGIPVVPGSGVELGQMTQESAAIDVRTLSTAEIARFRAEADAQSGGRMPALVQDPTVGLVIPRVDAGGILRTVMMLNARIEPQKPIRIHLRGVAKEASTAIWHAFGEPPETIPLRRSDSNATLVLPQLGSWNAGWFEFE